MDLNTNLRSFTNIVTTTSGTDPEALAHAQNFSWDERPPKAGSDLYGNYFTANPVTDIDDWNDRHNDYVAEQLQTDQSLRKLWLYLSKLPAGMRWETGLLSLLGLRLMPADNNGTPEHGLPRNLLHGLLNLGEAHVRSQPGDRKGRAWKQELDFLAMVYPMSKEVWSRKFRAVLQARTVLTPVRHWLDSRFPNLDKPIPKGATGTIQPPFFDHYKQFIRGIDSNLSGVRPQLEELIHQSRVYAEQSGDGSSLVLTFCNLAKSLLAKDAGWARVLSHEALLWEPQNPHPWSLLARALESEGDWRRAEAVFWQARRRFPHEVKVHSQLAHNLLTHGHAAQSEAIYREAIQLFPNDPVCYAGLAHSLRIRGQREQAVIAYRDAQRHFHRDEVIANGLTDTLIDLQRLDQAQEALDWAEQVVTPGDPTLVRIRRRLQAAQAGEAVTPRRLSPSEEGNPGDLDALDDLTGQSLRHAASLGRAGLFRRQGPKQLAAAWKEIETLPDNSERLIETGLWHQAESGWADAADWFEQHWQRYPGDGVLRVHHLRAQARAERAVDWTLEHKRYPGLLPVILTEERGEPAHLNIPLGAEDLSTEQQQDRWYQGLIQAGDARLRDLAEEHLLAARHGL